MEITEAEDTSLVGRQLSTWIMLPGEDLPAEMNNMSVGKIKRLIIAAGISDSIEDDTFDTEDLHMAELNIVVTVEELNGQERNNVKDVLSL